MNLSTQLQAKLNSAVINADPHFAEVIGMESYRPGYLPYPAKISIRTTNSQTVECVLKVSQQPKRLLYEGKVLKALTDLGLSVPKVLVAKTSLQHESNLLAFLLMSKLPGVSLPWINLSDLNTAFQTSELVHQGVDTLHALTDKVKSHPIEPLLPSVTLESELQKLITNKGPWLEVSIFAEALDLLSVSVPEIRTPLVFSNGDYNPLNFLAEQNQISGWVDFEHACFEDPYIGFAKFFLWADDDYGWGAGAKAGLVERYLFKHQVAPSEFLVRLILRGLSYLHQIDPMDAPPYMLQVITEAVGSLKSDL